MKNRIYYLLISFLIVTGILFNACKKEEHISHNIIEEQYEGKVTGINDAYIDLQGSNATVEQFNIENGTAIISFPGKIPEFLLGEIITIDVDTMGYLKKVKSSQINGKTVTVQTEPAYLNDIFVDIDFKLKTEMLEPNQILKSSSTSLEISKALTDKAGYIHPIEIIYHDSKGMMIKKSALRIGDDINGNHSVDVDADIRIINLKCDFSNTDLHGKEGDNIHFYISEGNVSLTSDAVFEFDFAYEGELDENTKIKKGDLKMFKFYLDSKAGFLAKLNLDMTSAYEFENEKKLFDLKKVTAKFLVAGVPVWITFECDVYGKYNLNADAALHTDWGFESNHTLKVGGTYNKENDNFIPIKEYVPENIIYPFNLNGEINLNAHFEIYPKVEVMFYGFFGPYAEIVPYLNGNYNAAMQNHFTNNGTETFLGWNSELDLGLDFRIGTKLTFLWGLFDKEFGPLTYNCFETPLWKSPYKITLVSPLPDVADINIPISLTYKVTDLRDSPTLLCPIILEGDGTFSKTTLFTDLNGEAKANWTLKYAGEANNVTARIYNADKTEISHVNKSIIGSGEINFITDIEGNVYKTVKIGTQTWMAENLKTTKYRNGDLIGTTMPATLNILNETTPKYQWAYGGNESNASTYGRLYTWYAITDSRNVCPTDWHVPTDAEWHSLILSLDGGAQLVIGIESTTAGGKMKEIGTSHWLNPNDGANNESGFSGLPGGYRFIQGSFSDIGNFGVWWTFTEYDTNEAWYRNIYSQTAAVNRNWYTSYKSNGISLRCVKDN